MAVEKFSSEEIFQKPYITLVIRDPSLSVKEIVRKLHRQFSHCSSDKLKRVIVSSGISDPDILSLVDSISNTCQICKVYKKPGPKLIVRLPLASQFNHTVAMDLKSCANGVWILHLIDTFTRYSAACKDKDVIVEATFKIWISYFGRPKRFYAENGGEFNNDLYRDMCQNLNVVIGSTAAESPWSNGLCERHNAVLGESTDKIIEDSNCSLSTAVSWTVSAKNALQNNYGYSPNQLIFW